MKAQLLKKLRSKAKKKYVIEPHPINDRTVDYRIMLNENKESKILFHYRDLSHAIAVRNKLRKEDVILNLNIIRYQRFKKKYK